MCLQTYTTTLKLKKLKPFFVMVSNTHAVEILGS